ncbi:MAG: hypothetical protein KF706_10810 [Chitinophagales bacterium]|nr:hypothetical protein [Chitinophagales bacterium]
MRNYPLFIILVTTSLLLSSCGNKLTREKAAKLIVEFYEYPNVELANIKLEEFGKRDESYLNDAVNNGYLTVSKNGYAAYGMKSSGNVFGLTKKSNPFITKKTMGLFGLSGATVISNCRNFFEVTGIKENEADKTAIVEFSCKRKGITPLGSVLGYKDGDVVNYKVNLTLYDDGWRITDKAYNISPTQYAFFTKEGEYVEQEYFYCDSKVEVTGMLTGVYHLQDPCAYPYLEVTTDKGKREEIYIDMNLDKFKVNNRPFFKWSASKIENKLANDPSQIELIFPNESFDTSILNKPVTFCCYKQQLNCGDGPTNPLRNFCKQIIEQK